MIKWYYIHIYKYVLIYYRTYGVKVLSLIFISLRRIWSPANESWLGYRLKWPTKPKDSDGLKMNCLSCQLKHFSNYYNISMFYRLYFLRFIKIHISVQIHASNINSDFHDNKKKITISYKTANCSKFVSERQLLNTYCIFT